MKENKDATIKRLREEIRGLRANLSEMESDRNIYRDYCVANFKWFVKLIGEGKTPCLQYLIKEHGRLFNKAKRFYMELGS